MEVSVGVPQETRQVYQVILGMHPKEAKSMYIRCTSQNSQDRGAA